MALQGILFDLYGTLIDIETDESQEEIYRAIAHFLSYQGVYLHRWEVRDRYCEIMKHQKEERGEKYPEIDVEAIWRAFLRQQGIQSVPARRTLARILAQLFRAISRNRLRRYPGVTMVLDRLYPIYRLALVSDAQPVYALPEIKAVGLDGYFDPIIISAQHGFRKPDPRLIGKALEIMKLTTAEVIFVGNDIYRDIYGAGRMGIKTILINPSSEFASHSDITPDYTAHRFEDVLKGIEDLTFNYPRGRQA